MASGYYTAIIPMVGGTCLEGQGALVSILTTPITHVVRPVIPIIHLLIITSPDLPSRVMQDFCIKRADASSGPGACTNDAPSVKEPWVAGALSFEDLGLGFRGLLKIE